MKKKISLVLFSIIFFNLNANKSSYSKISQYHLNSFEPNITEKDFLQSLNPATGKIDKEKLQKIIKEKFIEPRKYTEILLTIFDLSEEYKNINLKMSKTSKKLFENLEIFCGEHIPSSHLLEKINRTKSFAGKAILSKILIEPTKDINELNRRQNIIKELVANEKTFNSLNQIITNYSLLEKDFLDFFKEKSFNQLFGSENYFPNIFWNIRFILDLLPKKTIKELGINNISDEINKKNILLTIFNLYGLYIKGKANYEHITKGFLTHAKLAQAEFNENKTKNAFLLPAQFLFNSGMGKYYIGRTIDDTRNLYYQIQEEKKNYLLVKKAFNRLKKISSIINNIKQINNVINENVNLKNKIIEFNKIQYFFENKPSKSHFFDIVLKNLQTKIFNKEKTSFLYLFFLRGKILSTTYLLAKTQSNLIDFVKSIGQIDCYLSIAKLYKESNKQQAKYCFAKYESKNKSYINIKNFWSPFINPKSVITNTIKLGGLNNNKCALITGPNAGGKSTILKSIIINVLLSQTITIAPAEKCIITPFSYIDTYLNITDNISGGNSLFKSEVLRVKNMLNKIRNSENSIIIVDEMFTGTNPTEGEAASYAIAKYIAQMSKNNQILALIASHYPAMTNLEQDTFGVFKNYQVTVNINQDNRKLNYPFKLQKGKNTQNVAIDILQSEGLDPEIINSARKIAV